MSARETCQVSVNRSGSTRWSLFEPCGRPVERDGKCKMHLQVEARRAEKQREWEEEFARDQVLRSEANALAEKLGIAVGLDFNSHAPGGGKYTGDFVVPHDWLCELGSL